MESGVRSRPGEFDVTTQKHLKARVRARMAETGERYAAARAQLVGGGGIHDTRAGGRRRLDTAGRVRPDTAALANVLAHAAWSVADGRSPSR